MKKPFSILIVSCALTMAEADASLINRGGGMIYDTVLDITWLQDANYAKTSGYSPFGLMNFGDANAWADQLSFGGFDDWRLPTLLDTGNPGCDFSNSRGTDCGWNSQTYDEGTGVVYSELAYMFYVNLGNLASHDPVSGDYLGGSVDWGITHTGPFFNLKNDSYWTQLEYAPDITFNAWGFDNYDGYQGANFKSNGLYAWAVRSGDVSSSSGVVSSVPLPPTSVLFSVGLFALFGFKKQFKANRYSRCRQSRLGF